MKPNRYVNVLMRPCNECAHFDKGVKQEPCVSCYGPSVVITPIHWSPNRQTMLEQEHLDLVNSKRTELGLEPLEYAG